MGVEALQGVELTSTNRSCGFTILAKANIESNAQSRANRAAGNSRQRLTVAYCKAVAARGTITLAKRTVDSSSFERELESESAISS